MPSFKQLDISGYGRRPVPNTLVWQEQETSHLAILFPGIGYRVTMPVLYYPGRVLTTHGADVLQVEYAYDRDREFQALSEVEQQRWFAADVEAAYTAGLAQRAYRQVTLVGKSIGTQAVAYLLAVPPQQAPKVQCIWLTPLLRDVRLSSRIKQARPHSLFAIGTADRAYDPAVLAEVEQATGGHSLIIEGANHSLEIPGDILASLHAMEQLVQAIERFLA